MPYFNNAGSLVNEAASNIRNSFLRPGGIDDERAYNNDVNILGNVLSTGSFNAQDHTGNISVSPGGVSLNSADGKWGLDLNASHDPEAKIRFNTLGKQEPPTGNININDGGDYSKYTEPDELASASAAQEFLNRKIEAHRNGDSSTAWLNY